MNKWYRLGQEFAKKFDDKNVYDYLKKNNLCNNFTDSQGKDFKEKDYKKQQEMLELSLLISKLMEEGRMQEGIVFDNDK